MNKCILLFVLFTLASVSLADFGDFLQHAVWDHVDIPSGVNAIREEVEKNLEREIWSKFDVPKILNAMKVPNYKTLLGLSKNDFDAKRRTLVQNKQKDDVLELDRAMVSYCRDFPDDEKCYRY